MNLSFENIIVEQVPLLSPGPIQTAVLRLDLLHPVISGNKWFKLRYYLDDALIQKKKRIVTFGGYYSNHLVATAAACQQSGFESIGIVRGEKPRLLSSTLLEAAGYGMRLLFHNHELYRQRFIPPELTSEDTFVIDQGGYGLKGVEGATTILDYGPGNFSHICCAVGTGTMMAGLVRAVHPEQQVIGISAMKNNSALDDVIFHFNEGMERKWKIFHDYHFGGFAKHKPELIRFMNDFYEQTGLPSDFVYTGKLFYAINDLLRNDFFPAHSRILLIHSGGLQGNNSLQKGTLIF